MSTTPPKEIINWDEVQKKLGPTIIPRLLVGGKSGTGKSSVLNALLGDEIYETDVIPCTKENKEAVWESQGGKIITIDAPGFAEANAPELEGFSYEENLLMLAELSAHIFILILQCNDRALEKEEQYLKLWSGNLFLNNIPVIIVVNKIDLMKPSKDRNLSCLNLDNPQREKEKNIKKYLDYLADIPVFQKYFLQGRVIPFSAGESIDDEKYGVEILQRKIYNVLPDAAKTLFIRTSKLKELREQEARRVIVFYATICAAEGIQPIPIIDSFLMTPVQIAMVIHIGKIYHIEITRAVAGSLITTLGSSLLGNLLFLSFVSFFPGIKQIIGPGVAFGIVYTMGLIVSDLFSQGNIQPSKEELKKLVEKYNHEGKQKVNEYKESKG